MRLTWYLIHELLFLKLIKDNKTVVLQEQTVKENADLYNVSKLKFDVGLKPITDMKSAESQYIIAKTNLLSAQNTVIADKRNLQALINIYPQHLAPLKKNLKLLSPSPNQLDYWVQKAYKNNYDLKSQQFSLENKQKLYSASWAKRYLPIITLNGSINERNQDNNNETIFSGDYSNYYSASINLSFNLLNKPLSSTVDRSKVTEQNQFYTLIQTKKNIQKETSDNFRNIQYWVSEIKAQQQAVASSELSYKAFLAGYKVGTKTITDVQNTLTQLSQSRLNEAKARYQYIIAWINFKQTVGTLSMTDIIKTNHLLVHT